MKNKIKAIILTAPSGAGKTSIKKVIEELLVGKVDFSISAVTRDPRYNEKLGIEEKDGVDYFFISKEEFQNKIDNNEFVEYEEVYEGIFYGTLKSEVQRINNENKIALFDVDVKGAKRLKEYFKDEALSIFIKAPSIEVLKERLLARKTESEDDLKKRLSRVDEEMTYENSFDVVYVNDIKAENESKVRQLLEQYNIL